MGRPIIEQLINAHVTYDQFELNIPQCFRSERRLLLDDMDNKIDEIYNQIRIENENSSEITKEGRIEEHQSSVTQLASEEISNSSEDVISFKNLTEQKIPERFLDKAKEKRLRELLAIKLLQKHIRAMRDRIIGNECMYFGDIDVENRFDICLI